MAGRMHPTTLTRWGAILLGFGLIGGMKPLRAVVFFDERSGWFGLGAAVIVMFIGIVMLWRGDRRAKETYLRDEPPADG